MKDHPAFPVAAAVARRPALIVAAAAAALASSMLLLDAASTEAGAAPRTVRDHRPQPIVRDQRKRVHDHRAARPAPRSGGVSVTSKPRVPCLGNLC